MIPKPNGDYWNRAWNPIKVRLADGTLKGYHCTKCGPGCANCWAEKMNMSDYFAFGNGLPYDNREVQFEIDEKVLAQPAKWRKPQIVFVCHLMDLFHEQIPDKLIEKVFKSIADQYQHRFLILTKRPLRMYDRFRYYPQFYAGVTVCNQTEANKKIPILLSMPTEHRWLSIEPMLGAITIPQGQLKQLDWVVVGGESGRNPRFMNAYWVLRIRDDCIKAGVPFYFKQWHKKKDGRFLEDREWNQLPKGLTL